MPKYHGQIIEVIDKEHMMGMLEVVSDFDESIRKAPDYVAGLRAERQLGSSKAQVSDCGP
ncbi:uncharacterized protein PgNI_12425 [Pyricularia grisea]|uniref:Uncharacterized protein n=1 Tax=Pyricularia grisea TaxID=148305 RepID=A0A6P8AMH8_PYRGI|nr:uncharacterized protein PgNI_12425 [Pyricularia grisea]TLD03236.1 hypothetical protein PgNI_12425 [Pyricularia grisea]